MLWKEMAIGFLISGFLATLVPSDWWKTLFLNEGPLFLQVVENAIAGPLIAVASFVCSIGNVPLGQRSVEWWNQLWRGSLIYLCRPGRDPFDLDLPKILRDQANFLYCPSDVYFDGRSRNSCRPPVFSAAFGPDGAASQKRRF